MNRMYIGQDYGLAFMTWRAAMFNARFLAFVNQRKFRVYRMGRWWVAGPVDGKPFEVEGVSPSW